MIKLLILSDDFTGALDTGVHFAQNGARTKVVFDRDYKFSQDDDTEVIVIDAETRCRLPRYLTKPRQRRSEWDMAGSDGISRVSAVFRGKSLLTNKMRII